MKITVEEKNFLCSYTIADAHGEFEMADADVETLVALIREKKTTDINKLGINESHPAIYELLREEINSIRYYSACDHDMREGIFNAECEWDVDTDELIDYCRQNCGLKNSEFYEIYEEYFDSDDDDDDEAYVEVHKKRGKDFYDCFWAWYRHYVDTAPYEDIDELFHALYDPDYECDFDSGYDTDPFIPQQIIEMAGGDEYIIFNIAEVDGDILWVNHDTSRSVDDVEEDEFTTILTNSVWLTNDEVTLIIDLIHKTKTTDVYRMNLSEIYPDIYRKLDESLARCLDDCDLGGLRADYSVILPERIIDMAEEGDN